MIVFSRRPSLSNSAITRPTFQSHQEIDARYARMTCFASLSLAPRPMNKSALRLRMAALGNPGGTVGQAAKSGVSLICSAGYMSKNFLGAAGGLWGLEKP